MGNEANAAGALAAAVIGALREVPELSQVSDGAPLQAGDGAAVVETGPETDWGFKGGEGAEVRFALLVTCGGEGPARARLLGEKARAAVARIGPELGPSPGSGQAEWRLASLVMVRSRTVRAAGRGWTAVVDYRARMTR